jgi:two-component system, cell cycle sensor histidine kinase and response regulator CckA
MADPKRSNAHLQPHFPAEIIDSVEAPIFATDPQGKFTVFNKQAEQFFGWSATKIIGKNITALSSASGDPQQLIDIIRFIAIGRSWSGDIIANRQDGSSFSARVNLGPIRDKNDRILGMVGVAAAVATSSTVEAKLRESDERLHFALSVGGAYIWELNVETSEAVRSHSTAGAVGFASSDAQSTLERIHPEDRERVREEFAEAIRKQEPLQTEYRFLHPDGRIIWLSAKGQMMPTRSNEARKFVGVLFNVTERKTLELRLQQNESRFRDFAEIASDWLWEMDENFIVISVMGRSHPSFGDRSPWTLGKTPWSDLEPISREWRRHLEEHLYPHKPFVDFEHDFVLDGESRRFSSRGRPIFDHDGRFCGYRCATTDKTARHRAQTELNTRARQQQAMATLSKMALDRAPLEELTQTAVELVAKTLRVPFVGIFERADSQEPLLLTAGIGWQPEASGDQSWLRSFVGRAIASPDPIVVESLCDESQLRSSGPSFEPAPMSGVAANIATHQGRSGALVALATEPKAFGQTHVSFIQAISFVLASALDQHTAEETLRLRDRALGAINQGILITDSGQDDDPIIYVNPAFERITGYCADEVVGKNFRFLQGQNSDRQMAHDMRSAMEEHRNFAGMILNYRKDGSEFWNEVTLAPVADDRREVTHFVGTHADVSKRVELEAQLRQAQKMEAVGQLTGGIAHDFNNLLTVIIGNAEILTQELRQHPVLKTTAELVLAAAERGAELTQRLLTFGRRQTLRPQPINLNEAVSSMLDLLRRTIGEQITLTVNLADELPSAFVDRSLLETALLNLVINARDAMPRGGALNISTRAVKFARQAEVGLEPGQYSEIAVTDTGFGMSTDVKQRAFEPFFTTKPVGKGSGLGLAMVYGFAKQSGGHVLIESEPGRGTSIRVALPQAASATLPVARPERAATEPAGRGEKVLIVEDEAAVRSWVASTIAGLGYTPLEVADGRTALKILEADNGVAVLFTDVMLPGGMTGLELADAARRLRPELRVLFTSGYSEDLNARSAATSSDLPILAKPYRKHALASLLETILGRKAFLALDEEMRRR